MSVETQLQHTCMLMLLIVTLYVKYHLQYVLYTYKVVHGTKFNWCQISIKKLRNSGGTIDRTIKQQVQ